MSRCMYAVRTSRVSRPPVVRTIYSMVRVAAESYMEAEQKVKALHPDRAVSKVSIKLFDPRGRDVISVPRTSAFTPPDGAYAVYVITWGYMSHGAFLIYAEDTATGFTVDMEFAHATSLEGASRLPRTASITRETGHELAFCQMRQALLRHTCQTSSRQLKADTDAWVRAQLKAGHSQ